MRDNKKVDLSVTDEEIGVKIIELLGLTLKDNGRVDTIHGDKTPKGLTRTLTRMILTGY